MEFLQKEKVVGDVIDSMPAQLLTVFNLKI
jgi:hypothetical protein